MDNKLIIEVRGSSKESPKKVSVKENNKTEEHYKKYKAKLFEAVSNCGIHSWKAASNLLLVFWYALTVLGDLFLLWSDNKKKNGSKKETKEQKNILDEGW